MDYPKEPSPEWNIQMNISVVLSPVRPDKTHAACLLMIFLRWANLQVGFTSFDKGWAAFLDRRLSRKV